MTSVSLEKRIEKEKEISMAALQRNVPWRLAQTSPPRTVPSRA